MKTKLPFILVAASMVLGVFISILFGANEALLKDKNANDKKHNVKIKKIMDVEKRQAKIEKEKSKNWRYYQRFHFHSTGISAMSLGVLLLLAFSAAPKTQKLICSYLVSVGGFLYPFVWLFAAIYGPIIGRHDAKERFAIFGYMGGVFFLGLIFFLFLISKYPIKFNNEPA